MLKVDSTRKSKLTKAQVLMALGFSVLGISLASPTSSIKAYAANEEVLFEDTEDDYKTEEIKEEDIVRDNTVVEPVEEKPEEKEQEEPKQEEKKEEKKNECITEDNGYDEEAGKYWDPSIKTEIEKKGLEENPPEEPPHNPPEEPHDNPPEETVVVPEQPQPQPTPAPAPAPKTGDLSVGEIAALFAGLSFGLYEFGSLYATVKNRKRK